MSCRHNALSKGIEAFISRMIADGPSANRPPHIALEPAPLLSSRSLTLAVPIAVIACALLAGGCDRRSGDEAQPQADAAATQNAAAAKLDRARKGTALPNLAVRNQQGEALDLASLKGKPTLINLWATWCAPCVAELPTLNRIASRADLDIEVVTISQDMGQPEKVQAFLDQRGLAQLPAWLDPEGDLPFKLGTATLPTTVLYDAEGREVWRYTGDNDWTSEAAMALLAEGGVTRK